MEQTSIQLSISSCCDECTEDIHEMKIRSAEPVFLTLVFGSGQTSYFIFFFYLFLSIRVLKNKVLGQLLNVFAQEHLCSVVAKNSIQIQVWLHLAFRRTLTVACVDTIHYGMNLIRVTCTSNRASIMLGYISCI